MNTPRLLIRSADGSVRAVIIRGVAKIGAASGNEVVLQHASVLPVHARVGVSEGDLWIEDAGGPAGTKVNGERVSRSALHHLDVVTIGEAVPLVVLNNDVAGSATRVVPPSAAPSPIAIGGATREDLPARAADKPITGIRLVSPAATFESALGLCIVGRGRDARFRIDSKDVSRKHAAILVSPTGATIEDLSSANGTTVNGKAIAARVPLADGDLVAFATFTFKVALLR